MTHLNSSVLIGSKSGSGIYWGFIIGAVMKRDCLMPVKRGGKGREGGGGITNDMRGNEHLLKSVRNSNVILSLSNASR